MVIFKFSYFRSFQKKSAGNHTIHRVNLTIAVMYYKTQLLTSNTELSELTFFPKSTPEPNHREKNTY